jgi:ribosomal protein L21E
MSNEPEYQEGDEVEIVSVSDGQHHKAIGDGHEYFVGLTGTVMGPEKEGKVFVFMPEMDYFLGFRPVDLELLKPKNRR